MNAKLDLVWLVYEPSETFQEDHSLPLFRY